MINDDPRLGEILTEGINGDFCLIGFPHHIGAKRDSVQIGQDHGPGIFK